MHANEHLRAAVAYAGRRPAYSHPIAFRGGAVLQVQRQDEEWPEFFWCTASDGCEGWVHQSFFSAISALPAPATAIADYDARELALTPGERLLVGEDIGGWRWAYAASGDSGWVRKADLTHVEDDPRFTVRPITPADDTALAAIIRTVMPEFGADGPGFAIHDAEVSAMHAAYASDGAAYFVVEKDGEVLGGGGIAALIGGDGSVCELRKMYFLPVLRGLGAGTALIGRCLDAARVRGYRQCYLETLTGMDAAQALYQRAGFQRIDTAMGNTGHFACNRFFLRTV